MKNTLFGVMIMALTGCGPGPYCTTYVECCEALDETSREAARNEGLCASSSASGFEDADESNCIVHTSRVGGIVREAGGRVPAACTS